MIDVVFIVVVICLLVLLVLFPLNVFLYHSESTTKHLPNKHELPITRECSMYKEHFVRKTVSLLKCECPLLERGCKLIGSLEDCEKHCKIPRLVSNLWFGSVFR